MSFRVALPALLLAALLAGAGPPTQLLAAEDEAAAPESPERPRIFKWIDENGIAHYTTDRGRIPASLRRKSARLGGGEPAMSRQAVSARAPADNFDAWVTRNRNTTVRDAWDEGVYEGEPGDRYAGDEGRAGAAPLSDVQLAEIAVERDDVDQQIIEIEEEVAAYEELMKLLISDPNIRPLDREESPDFRAVAQQLPQRLTELRALQERREELESP